MAAAACVLLSRRGVAAVAAATTAVVGTRWMTSACTTYPPPSARAAATAGPAAPTGVTLVESPATIALLTTMRDVRSGQAEFVRAADRLMRIIAEEALAALPGGAGVTVTTPCGAYNGLRTAAPSTAVVVSIMRSGDALLETVRAIEPAVGVGKILIQRDEEDAEKRPKLFYCKLPGDVAARPVLLVDPMLASGGSATMALRELVKAGVPEDRIVFANVVACPEGIAAVRRHFPRVKIVTAAIDGGLNEHKYIVPGLGDYGDRYYGTTVSNNALRNA